MCSKGFTEDIKGENAICVENSFPIAITITVVSGVVAGVLVLVVIVLIVLIIRMRNKPSTGSSVDT